MILSLYTKDLFHDLIGSIEVTSIAVHAGIMYAYTSREMLEFHTSDPYRIEVDG